LSADIKIPFYVKKFSISVAAMQKSKILYYKTVFITLLCYFVEYFMIFSWLFYDILKKILTNSFYSVRMYEKYEVKNMENITLEEIWKKLEDLDSKLVELAEYIQSENLKAKEAMSYTRDDLNFLKHNMLLIRQHEVNIKDELAVLEEK
jgi:hypothetical protein